MRRTITVDTTDPRKKGVDMEKLHCSGYNVYIANGKAIHGYDCGEATRGKNVAPNRRLICGF